MCFGVLFYFVASATNQLWKKLRISSDKVIPILLRRLARGRVQFQSPRVACKIWYLRSFSCFFGGSVFLVVEQKPC